MVVLPSLFRFFECVAPGSTLFAITFSFLLGFLSGGVGCRAAAVGSQSGVELDPPEILRVATSGDYAPFSLWREGEAEPIGFSISMVKAYAKERRANVTWVRFRWPELSAAMAAGSFDLALSGITIRPERSMQGRFSLPLARSGAVVLVPADSSLDSVDDLNRPSVAIAVNAGGHLERVARRLFPLARIEAIPDNPKVLAALARGSAQAVLTDTIEARQWQRSSRPQLRAIGPLTRDLKAAWFPPEKSREAERFSRWLLRAESSGLLDRLRRAHGLESVRTAEALPALLASLDERLSLMPAVAEAKRVLALPIADLAREELVLDSAETAIALAAKQAGASPPDRVAVRRFFRAQVEAAKWIQSESLRGRAETREVPGPAARHAARSQLDDFIRPALLFLGDRISMLIIACGESGSQRVAYEDVVLALEQHELPPAQLREIYEALSKIVTLETTGEPAHRPRSVGTSRVPSA